MAQTTSVTLKNDAITKGSEANIAAFSPVAVRGERQIRDLSYQV